MTTPEVSHFSALQWMELTHYICARVRGERVVQARQLRIMRSSTIAASIPESRNRSARSEVKDIVENMRLHW